MILSLSMHFIAVLLVVNSTKSLIQSVVISLVFLSAKSLGATQTQQWTNWRSVHQYNASWHSVQRNYSPMKHPSSSKKDKSWFVFNGLNTLPPKKKKKKRLKRMKIGGMLAARTTKVVACISASLALFRIGLHAYLRRNPAVFSQTYHGG